MGLHSEVPGVRTSTYKFWGDTIQLITLCGDPQAFPLFIDLFMERGMGWGHPLGLHLAGGWAGRSRKAHFIPLAPRAAHWPPSSTWHSGLLSRGGFSHGGWLPRGSTSERVPQILEVTQHRVGSVLLSEASRGASPDSRRGEEKTPLSSWEK